MPNIYLSPSTEEDQFFVTGNSEEYYMNLITDAMIPYLRASGIDFDRNDPGDTVKKIVEKSNSEYRDLHLMLHMAIGVGNLAGRIRGENVIYYTGSPGGKKAADIFAKNLKTIYPIPELVTVSSDRMDPEQHNTNAVSLDIMLGHRDNIEDATWVSNHIDVIAKNLAMSLAEYLNVPFVDKVPAAGNRRY